MQTEYLNKALATVRVVMAYDGNGHNVNAEISGNVTAIYVNVFADTTPTYLLVTYTIYLDWENCDEKISLMLQDLEDRYGDEK